MKKIILEISNKLRNGEITEKEAQTDLCVLFNTSDRYSDADVRNIALEMTNEAITGLKGEQRWDMQERLGKIKDKWKLRP